MPEIASALLLVILTVAVFVLGIIAGALQMLVVVFFLSRMTGTDEDLFDALAYAGRMIVIGVQRDPEETMDELDELDDDED